MTIDKMIDDRYRLIELLDEGGTSLVFAAEDTKTHTLVALKILSPELADKPEYIEAFKKEAQVLSRLRHENIIELFSIGDKGKLKYFATKYVEGCSLKKKLQEGTLSIGDKIDIAFKICDALEYAHSMGIVHKDLKPANILITGENKPVLADFGIAEAPEISDGDKKEIFGTVQYFSPEQARGEKTDRRTDIYSMGVILYEMMTGELPFEGEDNLSVALKHLHQTPVSPIRKNPALPESISRIILKGMQKEKSRRYHTIADMQKDLARCMEEPEGKYVTGYEESTRNRRQRRTQKRKFPVFMGGIALLLILIASFVIMNTFGLFNSKYSGQVYVPSLTDKTVTEAENTLTKLGLVLEYRYEANGEVEEGRVISQSPDMGSLVNRGDSVVLVISQGTKVVKEIPLLTGMSEEEALRLLYDMGFINIEVSYVQKADSIDGVIVSQSPEEGETLSADSMISVVINHLSGGELKNIPVLVGKSVEDAIDEAKRCGFGSVHIAVSDMTDSPGKVISQFPTSDMTETDIDTIYLTVQRLQGNYSISGTIEYTPVFMEKSVVVATAVVETDGRKFEFVLLEGIFENDNAYIQAYPNGAVYNEQIGSLFKDLPYTLTVYLNYEVVYTKYVS